MSGIFNQNDEEHDIPRQKSQKIDDLQSSATGELESPTQAHVPLSQPKQVFSTTNQSSSSHTQPVTIMTSVYSGQEVNQQNNPKAQKSLQLFEFPSYSQQTCSSTPPIPPSASRYASQSTLTSSYDRLHHVPPRPPQFQQLSNTSVAESSQIMQKRQISRSGVQDYQKKFELSRYHLTKASKTLDLLCDSTISPELRKELLEQYLKSLQFAFDSVI